MKVCTQPSISDGSASLPSKVVIRAARTRSRICGAQRSEPFGEEPPARFRDRDIFERGAAVRQRFHAQAATPLITPDRR